MFLNQFLDKHFNIPDFYSTEISDLYCHVIDNNFVAFSQFAFELILSRCLQPMAFCHKKNTSPRSEEWSFPETK